MEICPQCGEVICHGNYCENCGWNLEKKFEQLELAFSRKDYKEVQRILDEKPYFTNNSPYLKTRKEEEDTRIEDAVKKSRINWLIGVSLSAFFVIFLFIIPLIKLQNSQTDVKNQAYTEGYEEAIEFVNNELIGHEYYEFRADNRLDSAYLWFSSECIPPY